MAGEQAAPVVRSREALHANRARWQRGHCFAEVATCDFGWRICTAPALLTP